jgi:hypothetical protein
MLVEAAGQELVPIRSVEKEEERQQGKLVRGLRESKREKEETGKRGNDAI